MTIEERANKTYPIEKDDWDDTIEWTTMADILEDKQEAYIKGATEQKDLDGEIINMLIDMLQTSKNYHLGITALDSPEEIIEKRRTRETALIRNIESKIERAKRAMEE